MPIRTPPLYATGAWSLLQPFEVKPNAIYTCKAIRSIKDLKARGIDPFETFYEPYGLTYDEYENDVLNLVNIVTLFSDNEPVIYVPDTYIESYPDVTTVPYSQTVLSISLGLVPDTLALDDVRDKIKEIVINSVGMESEVKEHVSGVPGRGVEQFTHETLENNRKAKIENNTTFYSQLLACQDENNDLKTRINTLERIIIDNGLLD